MGIRQVPAHEIECCDFCGRGKQYLQACWVCGRQFCLIDKGNVGQSYGFTTLCRECTSRDDVRKTCHRYAKQLMPIFRRRDAALKRLAKVVILLALLLSGCAVQRQTVRVEVNAPATRPDQGRMAATWEVEVR